MELEQRVRDTLGTAFGDEMLVRWVLLAEVIDTDGERAVWNMTSEDARAWDTLGLLTYATQIEQAGIVADHRDDE